MDHLFEKGKLSTDSNFLTFLALEEVIFVDVVLREEQRTQWEIVLKHKELKRSFGQRRIARGKNSLSSVLRLFIKNRSFCKIYSFPSPRVRFTA